jgi:hypothetical protein
MGADWQKVADFDAAAGTPDRAVVQQWVEERHGRRLWEWVDWAEGKFKLAGDQATYRVRLAHAGRHGWVIEKLVVKGARHQ